MTRFVMAKPDDARKFDDLDEELYLDDDEPDRDDPMPDPDEWRYELADIMYDLSRAG